MMRPAFLLAVVLALGACATDANRYAVAPPEVSERIRIAFSSVELREVSLPTYAAADEIHQETPDGVLKSTTDVLWADTPERAVALSLSRNMAKLTRAQIASDPWPFEAFPDARLDIRFEELLARADGRYQASGQYFVAVEEGRERSGLFDLTVDYDPAGGAAAIAEARGTLILNVAAEIAREGLR